MPIKRRKKRGHYGVGKVIGKNEQQAGIGKLKNFPTPEYGKFECGREFVAARMDVSAFSLPHSEVGNGVHSRLG
jgi:hypothetical protein